MSRIYFHSPDEDTEVAGPERHMAGTIASQLLWDQLGLTDYLYGDSLNTVIASIKSMLPPGHWLQQSTGADFVRGLETLCHVASSEATIKVDGQQVPLWVIGLNTMFVMGSDPVKLLARLHGQCEIHCWVDGPDRAWLAGIIDEGRKHGIYRADMGWEDTARMLRESAADPVVCSYSVCDQFPNYRFAVDAGWKPSKEPVEDEFEDSSFYDLSERERWDICMPALRQCENLQLSPECWADYYFEPHVNAFDLRAAIFAPMEVMPP